MCVFIFLVLFVGVLCIFWIHTCIAKVSPNLWLVHFLNSTFGGANIYIFNVQFIFMISAFELLLRNLCPTQVYRDIFLCSRRFPVLSLTFGSVIYNKFIFVSKVSGGERDQ